MVSELPGVSEVAVSVLGKSAVVIIDSEDVADSVVETVMDCGFEAQVVSVEPLDTTDTCQPGQTARVVSFRVDGMFCP